MGYDESLSVVRDLSEHRLRVDPERKVVSVPRRRRPARSVEETVRSYAKRGWPSWWDVTPLPESGGARPPEGRGALEALTVSEGAAVGFAPVIMPAGRGYLEAQ